MFGVRVEVSKGGNLNAAVDRILEGELNNILETDEVKADTAGSGLFAADPSRTVAFEVNFKEVPAAEKKAEILAAIRRIVGPDASIQEIS